MILFLLLPLLQSTGERPLLGLYTEALELWSSGEREAATSLFAEIAERMPHEPRALYNLAALSGEMGLWGRADTIMTGLSEWDGLGGDSLFNAGVSAALGKAMAGEDYAGVERQLNTLLPRVASATADSLMRHNYEVALRWLDSREPPPDQSQQNDDESEDESESENEDQEESQDDEEQEDQQGENEDESENENENENEEDQGGDDNSEDTHQPPPPADGEMTQDEAQRILDMVEEAEPRGDKDASGVGVPGTPTW